MTWALEELAEIVQCGDNIGLVIWLKLRGHSYNLHSAVAYKLTSELVKPQAFKKSK